MADENNNGQNSETALLETVGPVLEQRFQGKMPETFTTDSGVVLGLRKISSNILGEAMFRLKPPRPPEVYDEAKQRSDPNPLDPTYLDAMDAWSIQRAALVNVVYLGRGTTLRSKPDDVLGVDEDWDGELLELVPDLNITFPDKGTKQRYVSWLRNYVLNDDDHSRLLSTLQGYYGALKEEQVSDAMRSFPGVEARGTDNGHADTQVGA